MEHTVHAEYLVKRKIQQKQDHFLIKMVLSLSTPSGESLKTKINLAGAMEISAKQ